MSDPMQEIVRVSEEMRLYPWQEASMSEQDDRSALVALTNAQIIFLLGVLEDLMLPPERRKQPSRLGKKELAGVIGQLKIAHYALREGPR